jgi:hypothetical protein
MLSPPGAISDKSSCAVNERVSSDALSILPVTCEVQRANRALSYAHRRNELAIQDCNKPGLVQWRHWSHGYSSSYGRLIRDVIRWYTLYRSTGPERGVDITSRVPQGQLQAIGGGWLGLLSSSQYPSAKHSHVLYSNSNYWVTTDTVMPEVDAAVRLHLGEKRFRCPPSDWLQTCWLNTAAGIAPSATSSHSPLVTISSHPSLYEHFLLKSPNYQTAICLRATLRRPNWLFNDAVPTVVSVHKRLDKENRIIIIIIYSQEHRHERYFKIIVYNNLLPQSAIFYLRVSYITFKYTKYLDIFRKFIAQPALRTQML